MACSAGTRRLRCIPEISVDEVNASILYLITDVKLYMHDDSSRPYLDQEIGWFNLRKRDLKLLDDFQATCLIDADGFHSRRIRHVETCEDAAESVTLAALYVDPFDAAAR